MVITDSEPGGTVTVLPGVRVADNSTVRAEESRPVGSENNQELQFVKAPLLLLWSVSGNLDRTVFLETHKRWSKVDRIVE